jgi:hypothetical protein
METNIQPEEKTSNGENCRLLLPDFIDCSDCHIANQRNKKSTQKKRK